MMKTKEALERSFPVTITIITDPSLLDNSFDLVHIYNYLTIDITGAFFEKALANAIPIVSSPIYWDYSLTHTQISKYLFKSHFNTFTALLLKIITQTGSILFGKPRLFSKKFKNTYNYFINSSRLILPNSMEESYLLKKFTHNKNIIEKSRIVFNACDNLKEKNIISEGEFLRKYNIPPNYILQVGRIETIKNQINVVYALKDYPEIPIVFLGHIKERHYFDKVQKISMKRGNVYFVDNVPHDEVNNFYKYATLHILPSFRESPGLVSLEALENNCPIVVCNHKYTPVSTYFPDQQYVINPLSIKSIREITLRAYEEKFFSRLLLDKFSWENAAKQTYEAYKEILNGNF